MNAYLVTIPEQRCDFPSTEDYEPPEAWWPTGIFVAATPAQAKYDALRVWASSLRSGVYDDDWASLRVRLLERDLPLPRGEIEVGVDRGGSPTPRDIYDRLWWRASALLGPIVLEAA